MKLRDLLESADQYVYHVTFAENVMDIKREGLAPLRDSNWIKAGTGERYNEDGGVFAFAHPHDAFMWAFNMDWQFNQQRSIAIIRFRRTDHWEKDPSGDITLQTGKGDALRSMQTIPSEAYVDSWLLKNFGTPAELGVGQQEWIQGVIDKLSS